jgi:hypothetical protein
MTIRLALAIEAYANLSGMTEAHILRAMSENMDCQIAKNVTLLMFAAG